MSDLIDDLIEAARLLGATQAKKGFGCYGQEEARFERAMHESISDKAKRLTAERDELRRQLAEAQKEIHNLNWALGTEGYDQMATPEEQAEHEAAVRAHHDVLERLEEGKRAYEAMKRDAECWRALDQMMSDPDARLNVNAGGWAVLKCGLLAGTERG